MSKRQREATEEEEEHVPLDNQTEGDKATFTKPHSVKEKRVTAGAFKLSRYSALTDRDSIQVGSSIKELPFEVASEDSDEVREEDQPGKKDLHEHDSRGRLQR
jgi:hypothetical protein